MGGTIAFEIAHLLHQQGQKVALLALIDAYAPNERFLRDNDTIHSKIYGYAININRFFDTIILLESNEKLPYILETVRWIKMRIKYHAKECLKKIALKFYPDSEYALSREKEQVRSDTKVSYDSMKVYPGQVTLFRSRKTHLLYPRSRSWGWDELAEGGLDIHIVPGYYLSAISEPYVNTLAKQLKNCLDNAQALELESQNSAPL